MRVDNPVTGAVIPEKMITVEEIENNDQIIEEKYLSRVELTSFFTAVSMRGEYQDKEIFFLFAFSGFRSSELCGLKWTDVNFESNTIRITKQLDAINSTTYELVPPKTKGSVRIVPIDNTIITILGDLKEQRKSGPFIFMRLDGHPFTPYHVRLRMSKLLKHTSIKKHATPHIFRHTYISMLAEAGVALNTIMQRVGHEDEKTTLRIYTHVTNKMQHDADLKIKNNYSDVLRLSTLQEM